MPCYTEDLKIVAETVSAAVEADMPPDSTCTVWLLDDGNDPNKRAWVEGLGDDCVRYITGRKRPAGVGMLLPPCHCCITSAGSSGLRMRDGSEDFGTGQHKQRQQDVGMTCTPLSLCSQAGSCCIAAWHRHAGWDTPSICQCR